MDGLLRKGSAIAGILIAGALAAPGASANASRCPTYAMSRPFLAWHDSRQYTLFGGETTDNLSGAGWNLSGGASVVSTVLADGRVGDVLDLPAGAVAVTPPMCVDASNYPRARAMMSDLVGHAGIAVYVSYESSRPGTRMLAAGKIKNNRGGWYPSTPIMLHSGELRGDHMVRLTLVSGRGAYRLYNLYIDPRRVN